jgi:hypothetical protein
MAHDHAAAHASPEDEYLVTPPGAGHEHTDANVGIIVKFAFWLIVSAVVVHVGVWGMFLLFAEQRAETAASQPYPIAVGQEPRQPAAPRLQQFPVNEFYEFRQQEDLRLDSYRWVDRAAGRVQIPIDEAMRLTLERGLPSRAPLDSEQTGAQSGASQPADPALIPADSSAGRTMERRR